MESDKELKFRVMVTFPHVLEKAIENHNRFKNTDFEIVDTIYDDVPFCELKVTKYGPSDIFSLGYKLAAIERKMRDDGEIDW